MQVFWKVNQSMHTSDQEYQEYLPCLLSQSQCPVKNKAKKKIYNKLNHTPVLIGSYFQSIGGQKYRLHHHEQDFTSL